MPLLRNSHPCGSLAQIPEAPNDLQWARRDSNPHVSFETADFKSAASANSATGPSPMVSPPCASRAERRVTRVFYGFRRESAIVASVQMLVIHCSRQRIDNTLPTSAGFSQRPVEQKAAPRRSAAGKLKVSRAGHLDEHMLELKCETHLRSVNWILHLHAVATHELWIPIPLLANEL